MSSGQDFTVYAMKLQPSSQTGFFESCREKEVIGTGWDPKKSCDSPAEIEEAHKQVDQDPNHDRTTGSGKLRHELRYIVKEMNDGSGNAPADYVWVNEGSEYALCRVDSECTTSHDISESLRQKLTNEKGTQIHNIRHVEWTDVPVEFVPGYVKRKFIGRFGTLNRMKKGMDEEAKQIIERLHSVSDFDNERALDMETLNSKLETVGTGKMFSVLDEVDTEELVLDYLQSDGWRITKYSASDTQSEYECELRRVTEGGRETGFVQVKSGGASLNPDEFEDLANEGQVFLFSSPDDDGEHELSTNKKGINVIDPEDLMNYLQENPMWLPTPTLYRLSVSL